MIFLRTGSNAFNLSHIAVRIILVLARLKMDLRGLNVMESLHLHVLKNHRARNHIWTDSFINALRRFLSRRGSSQADWPGSLTPSHLLTIKCPARESELVGMFGRSACGLVEIYEAAK